LDDFIGRGVSRAGNTIKLAGNGDCVACMPGKPGFEVAISRMRLQLHDPTLSDVPEPRHDTANFSSRERIADGCRLKCSAISC
jgi:hypothetical protein